METQKKYKVLACKVMQRELAWVMVHSRSYLDVTFMQQKLHNTPNRLREALQTEIDLIESGQDIHSEAFSEGAEPQAILLVYGLCSNSVVGLHTSKYPLVIPRCHDCTSLFMGSKEAYADYFMKVRGTFFATDGWIERGLDITNETKLQAKYDEYMKKYEDEDTVEYLMEIERSMTANYHAITYIPWEGLSLPDSPARVREVTDEKGWDYYEFPGNSGLLQRLVDGEWNEEDFLVVQPGETVKPSYDERIMCSIGRTDSEDD